MPRSPLSPPSRSGAPGLRQVTQRSISGVDVGAGTNNPPRLSSCSAPYHLRKSYFKATIKTPLIFAEAGLLPFNPGRAGVQVPRSGGIRRSLPFVRTITHRWPCPGELHRPAGLLVSAIHRGISNLVAAESLHGEAEAAALFVLERIGLAKGRSHGRAHLSRLSPRPGSPVCRASLLPAPIPDLHLLLGSSLPLSLALGMLPGHSPRRLGWTPWTLVLPAFSCHLPMPAPAAPALQPDHGYGTAGVARRVWRHPNPRGEQREGQGPATGLTYTLSYTLPVFPSSSMRARSAGAASAGAGIQPSHATSSAHRAAAPRRRPRTYCCDLPQSRFISRLPEPHQAVRHRWEGDFFYFLFCLFLCDVTPSPK